MQGILCISNNITHTIKKPSLKSILNKEKVIISELQSKRVKEINVVTKQTPRVIRSLYSNDCLCYSP